MMDYSEYDEKVISYMDKLVNELTIKYGKIEDSWTLTLDMIAMNYHLIETCRKDILARGLDVEDSRGRISKNPSLMVLNQAQINLQKYLTAFGLNLLSASKIKGVGEEDDGLEDLIG